MYGKLLEKIKELDNITIFRHVRPDGDCTFSSLAMYYFLKENFKDKTVKMAGFEKFDLVSKIDKVSNKFIKNSLAIVLDTATSQRADDKRFIDAKYIIKIDHHPAVDNYGNLNVVKPDSSSTCELLSEIFFSKTFKEFKLTKQIYEYLYCGIVTDTLNFRTANTTSSTLKTASKLCKIGGLKPSDLYEYLNDVEVSTYRKINEIRNRLIIQNKFGYIRLTKKDLDKIGIDGVEAKNHIDEIGNIKELNIWGFAIENDGAWDCSLRSKRPYIINKFAAKYGGGGHANACAVKHVKASELKQLFDDLTKFSIKK